jgi:hypothetical protein
MTSSANCTTHANNPSHNTTQHNMRAPYRAVTSLPIHINHRTQHTSEHTHTHTSSDAHHTTPAAASRSGTNARKPTTRTPLLTPSPTTAQNSQAHKRTTKLPSVDGMLPSSSLSDKSSTLHDTRQQQSIAQHITTLAPCRAVTPPPSRIDNSTQHTSRHTHSRKHRATRITHIHIHTLAYNDGDSGSDV